MDYELIFKTISYGIVGILLVTALVLSLIAIRKESRSGAPIKSLIGLTLVVISLCAFVYLVMGYIKERWKKEITPHVRTEIVKADALPQ